MLQIIESIKLEIIYKFRIKELKQEFRIPYSIDGILTSLSIHVDYSNDKIGSVNIEVDADENEYITFPEKYINEINDRI